MNRLNGKTRTFPANLRTIAAYATGAPPTMTFQCKDIRSVNDVKITCDLGYACVPIARALNTVTFRIYKQNMHYSAAGGGGGAVTAAAAVPHVLEAVGGPWALDTTSMAPVEIPDGAIALNITGLAIGTK
jgi:hypothetical protein